MTDTQLYLAIGVPIVTNAAMLGIVVTLLLQHMNARFDAQDKRIDARFEAQEKLFTEKLLRVEQVLDARLRLIEDKLGIR